MIIKINDKIEVRKRNQIPRDGIITSISIATSQSDPAGELGTKVEELD